MILARSLSPREMRALARAPRCDDEAEVVDETWFLAAAQNREADAHGSLGHDWVRRRRRSQERSGIPEGRGVSARCRHAPQPREGRGFRAAAFRSTRARGRSLPHRGRQRGRSLRGDAALYPLRAHASGRRRRQTLPGGEADGHHTRRVWAHGRWIPTRGSAAVGGLLSTRVAPVPEGSPIARRGCDWACHVGPHRGARPPGGRRARGSVAIRPGDCRGGTLPRPRVTRVRPARFPARTGHRGSWLCDQHRRHLFCGGRHGDGIPDRRRYRRNRCLELSRVRQI